MEKEQEKRNQSYRSKISRAGKRGGRTTAICKEELVATGLKLMNENMEQTLKEGMGPPEKQEEGGADGGEWEESATAAKNKRKRRTREEIKNDKCLEVEKARRKEKRLAKAIQRAKGKMKKLVNVAKESKKLEDRNASSLFKRRRIGVAEDVVGGKGSEVTSTSSGDGGRSGGGGVVKQLVPSSKVKIFVSGKSRMDGILKEMETGPAVPAYPQRAVAIVPPKPVQRRRPVMKEIGIQVSLASHAMVPWAPINSRPGTVSSLSLPSPPTGPSISQQLVLMPPPPPLPVLQMQPMFLPTSPWSRIFQSTAAPPPSTAITPFRQPPQVVPPNYTPPPTCSAPSTSNQLVPVDPYRQSQAVAPPAPPPNLNQDKDEEELVILEPNAAPAWNLRKICFPKSRSSRTSSSKERSSGKSRSTHSSKSSSSGSSRHPKRSSCRARSSEKFRSFQRHRSSTRCRSSSRRSSSRRHPKSTGGILTPTTAQTYSDSPAEPARESDRCPDTSNYAVIKRCPKSDVKGWTKIADYSKRQWPEPIQQSESHPIRTINCYHVLREKKTVPLVDLTGSSSLWGRNGNKEQEINYTPVRGPKLPGLLALMAPPLTTPMFPPLSVEPPPVPPPPPSCPPQS